MATWYAILQYYEICLQGLEPVQPSHRERLMCELDLLLLCKEMVTVGHQSSSFSAPTTMTSVTHQIIREE